MPDPGLFFVQEGFGRRTKNHDEKPKSCLTGKPFCGNIREKGPDAAAGQKQKRGDYMKTIEIAPLHKNAGRMTGYLHDQYPQSLPGRVCRPCVLVLPGGAYQFVSERESDPIAFKFLSHGYHAFILDYSVGGEGKPAVGLQALSEVAEALAIIRQHAEEWGIIPNQIAVCGFSAGGHLAASSGILWKDAELQEERGGKKPERPDAMLLCYPVITPGEFAHRGSFDNLTGGDERLLRYFKLEKRVDADTAPAFVWHTVEDPAVPVENSLLLADALQRAKVPFECHLFNHGGHGLSLCNEEVGTPEPRSAPWMDLAIAWLDDRFAFRP